MIKKIILGIIKRRIVERPKGQLYFNDTKSRVTFVKEKGHILIPHIRSHLSGDAHLLMEELYKKFPNKIFRTDVHISPKRKRALKFWRSEGFKIIEKVKTPGMTFYLMEKKP